MGDAGEDGASASDEAEVGEVEVDGVWADDADEIFGSVPTGSASTEEGSSESTEVEEDKAAGTEVSLSAVGASSGELAEALIGSEDEDAGTAFAVNGTAAELLSSCPISNIDSNGYTSLCPSRTFGVTAKNLYCSPIPFESINLLAAFAISDLRSLSFAALRS